jgi:pyruvate ferredoxin oxidoreductase delta subunit
MMSSVTVEIVYRGIFQKTLGQRISRGIVLAARKEGKVGISFGRYGDSPERNGIPAKQFAIVADDELELQVSMARYEPTVVDISIPVDDTLCKGVESWAWYGTQPINKLLHENGLLLVTSIHSPETLLQWIHRQPYEYDLGIVKGPASFSGLWVYKDDHTDVRVLGTLARLAPQLFGLNALEQAILQEWNDNLKVVSAKKAFERAQPRRVLPHEGNPAPVEDYEKPKYWEMQEGIVVKGIAAGKGFRGAEEGFQPERNPYFKKYTTRSMRPVVDFDKCVKCTLCWLQCPDSCFDVTPEHLYDANMSACCGCGVCEAVCPVEQCITMVNESAFIDNTSQYEMWKQDAPAYRTWLQEKIAQEKPVEQRSHGFRYRGQYEEQIAAAQREEEA